MLASPLRGFALTAASHFPPDSRGHGLKGTGFLLRTVTTHGDRTRLMGTGFLLRTVEPSPFRHLPGSLFRVSCTSVNSFERVQCHMDEMFRSHSTCRDALSACVSRRFPGPADMGGTLARTLNTLYLYPPRHASPGPLTTPRWRSHHVIPQIA